MHPSIYKCLLSGFLVLPIPQGNIITTQPQLARLINVCVRAIVAQDTRFHARLEDASGTMNQSQLSIQGTIHGLANAGYCLRW